jgi:hypothetical protein
MAVLEQLARELPSVSDALSGQYLNHATAPRQLADGGGTFDAAAAARAGAADWGQDL